MALSLDSILEKKIVNRKKRLFLTVLCIICFVIFVCMVIFAKNIALLFDGDAVVNLDTDPNIKGISNTVRIIAFLILFIAIGFIIYLFLSAGKSYADVVLKEGRIFDLDLFGQEIIGRLKKEVERLQTASNINLSIGTFISLGGLSYLIFISITHDTVPEKSLIPYFLQKLSFIAFVEIFAFFFLRMYRATLNEIKYFNNEMTNVELLLISVNLVKSIEDNKERYKQLNVCLQRLVKVERNFILKKNETTIDNQKDKIEIEANKSVIDMMQKLFSTFKFGKEE